MRKCSRCIALLSLAISVVTLGLELYRLKLVIDERRERNRRCLLVQKLNECVEKLNAKIKAVKE